MKITLEQKDLLEIYGQLGVVGGSAVMVQFAEVDKKKMLENIEKAISEIKKILDNAVITSQLRGLARPFFFLKKCKRFQIRFATIAKNVSVIIKKVFKSVDLFYKLWYNIYVRWLIPYDSPCPLA